MKTFTFRPLMLCAAAVVLALSGSSLQASDRKDGHHSGGGSAPHSGGSHRSAPSHFIAHGGGSGGGHHIGFVQHGGVSHLNVSVLGAHHYSSPMHRPDFVTLGHRGGVVNHGRGATHFIGGSHRSGFADRSGYAVRHEHHTPGWYRDHGWFYDWNAWRLYHRHCYYNDDLGCMIFDTVGPDDFDDGYAVPQNYVFAQPQVLDLNTETEQPIAQGADSENETNQAVQDALAQAGYYRGEIDGIIGPASREAIANYQRDHGLSVTGYINDALIGKLGLQ